jgi:lysozyme
VTNVIGEDRSSFQRVSGWAGDSFGFAKVTEGTDWSDSTFKANWFNLRAEGKVRGAYHFFHPADDPVAQAQFFIATVKENGGIVAGDVFIADVEITAGDDGREVYGTERAPDRTHCGIWGDPLAAPVGPAALAFLNEVQALVGAQHRVMLYTDVSMAQNLLGACAGYPLFLAYYEQAPIVPAPWKTWTFWQNGATGVGGGDADYFNGDLAALQAWAGDAPPVPVDNWTETLVNNLPTLQSGSKDSGAPAAWYVHRLQNEVAGYGRWNGLGAVTAIAADGNFGPATRAAVVAVQRHAGLAQDGVVGRATWTALIA